MDILPGYKLCRNGLHLYSTDKKQCPECAKQSSKNWAKRNRERKNNYNKEYKQKLKEKYKNSCVTKTCKKAGHEYPVSFAQCPICKKETLKKWKQKNKKRHSELNVKSAKNNKATRRFNSSTRKAQKRKAVPAWASRKSIKAIYKLAMQKSQQTGEPHQVDHIFPLVSKWMCGLHVENNLQIITAKENLFKSNRTWPGQLDCQKGSVYDIFPKELTDLLDG